MRRGHAHDGLRPVPGSGRRAPPHARCRRGGVLRRVVRRRRRPRARQPAGRGTQLQLARPVPRPRAGAAAG